MVVGRPPRLEVADFSLHLGNGVDASGSESLDEVEQLHIRRVLEAQDWNITHSAEILGINRVTLYNKIKKFGFTHPAPETAAETR
jgi:transcriptional regulator of acetoin/glycerol metabolism